MTRAARKQRYQPSSSRTRFRECGEPESPGFTEDNLTKLISELTQRYLDELEAAFEAGECTLETLQENPEISSKIRKRALHKLLAIQ